MTQQERDAMMQAIEEGVIAVLHKELEVWVPAEKLMEQFSFSKQWLKEYGRYLPHTKPEGAQKRLYPIHKINKMMMDGSIERLTDSLNNNN